MGSKSLKIHLLLLCPFIFLLGNCSRAYSQQDSSSASSIFVSDGKSVFSDAVHIIQEPLHFSTNDWLATGAVASGFVLLITTDAEIRDVALRNHSTGGDILSEIGNKYGTAIYAIGLGGGIYAGGLAWKSNKTRETGLLLIESLAFAGAATDLSKIIFGRSRPYTEEGPHQFHPFTVGNNYLSMPSGHVTVAFAVSSLLAARIKNPYATAGLYSIATITAVARVYDDQHWFSDTFIAAAVGTFMGMTVSHIHDTDDGKQSLSLYPIISPTSNGLRATYTF